MRPENSLQNLFRENGGVADDFRDLCDKEKHSDPNDPNTLRAIYRLSLKFACAYLHDESGPEDIAGFRDWFNGKEVSKSHPILSARVKKMEQLAAQGGDDGAAIAALLDLPPTASVAREIIFGGADLPTRERFVGADLSSGSGITTAAAAIAGVRSNARQVELHSFELCKGTIVEATRTLSKLPTNVNGTRLSWHVHEADATTDAPYRRLLEAIGNERKDLQAVVSETFNNATPHPLISEGGLRWEGKQQEMIRARTKRFDPFMHVMEKLQEHLPWAFDQVREGETILFPDFINDRVKFALLGTRFKLLGITDPVCISNIGVPFAAFEDPELHTRFPKPETVRKNASQLQKREGEIIRELEQCVTALEQLAKLMRKRSGAPPTLADIMAHKTSVKTHDEPDEEMKSRAPLTAAERKKRNKELERRLKKKR